MMGLIKNRLEMYTESVYIYVCVYFFGGGQVS